MTDAHRLIHFYFKCLEEAGEQMTFDLIKTLPSGEQKSLCFNHLHYDGISALCEHIATLPGRKKVPRPIYQPPPPQYQKIWHLISWSLKFSFRQFYRPKGNSREGNVFGYLSFKIEDETNLNSRLLLALHKSLKTTKKTLWMIPVSLHTEVEIAMAPSNNVSFIDIAVAATDESENIKSKINSELKSGSYWGTIYSMWIPRLLGKKLFNKLFPYFHHYLRRTGTFTNLGKWEVEGLQENEAWIIKATVVPLNPIGASAIMINNQLSLGLQLHSCLNMGEEETKQILEDWRAFFEQKR